MNEQTSASALIKEILAGYQPVGKSGDLVRLRHRAEAVDLGGQAFELVLVDPELLRDRKEEWGAGELLEPPQVRLDRPAAPEAEDLEEDVLAAGPVRQAEVGHPPAAIEGQEIDLVVKLPVGDLLAKKPGEHLQVFGHVARRVRQVGNQAIR